MTIPEIQARGIVLLGCGKMGSAMLAGWLGKGLAPEAVTVLDPAPSDWLKATGVRLNASPPSTPAVLLIAVKPQMMGEALPRVAAIGGPQTLVLSVAAGTPILAFEAAFGATTPVIRAMPNTPAAVSRGITAIVGNGVASEAHLALAESLLGSVGEVVRLDAEADIDAVTGVSGSGPAYVFHLVEAMAVAAEAQGLSPDLSMRLARATVAGAGALLDASSESAATLRANVTSPNGTTAAGLSVLMADLPNLIERTVAAASDRARELGA